MRKNQLLCYIISARNNSWSPDIVQPNFENVWPVWHYMVEHNDSAFHQHILSYLLQGVVSQYIMSGPICKMSKQKEYLKGNMSCE